MLGDDAGRETEVAGVARELLADGGDPEDRDAGAVAGVDERREVADAAALVLAADEDLDGDGVRVDTDGVLDRHRGVLVGEVLEDRRSAGGAEHETRLGGGRDGGAQRTTVHMTASANSDSGAMFRSMRSSPEVGPWK